MFAVRVLNGICSPLAIAYSFGRTVANHLKYNDDLTRNLTQSKHAKRVQTYHLISVMTDYNNVAVCQTFKYPDANRSVNVEEIVLLQLSFRFIYGPKYDFCSSFFSSNGLMKIARETESFDRRYKC